MNDAPPEAENPYLHDPTQARNNAMAESAPGPAFEMPADPFEPVRELERTQGLPRKAFFGGAFSKIPLPTTQSNGAELVDYWKRANRAGAPVTANDLETYVDLLGDQNGQSVLINNRTGPGLSPGLQKMGHVFAEQHPAEVKRTLENNAVALMSMRDAHEELFPQMCADTDPARVTADPKQFEQHMAKVAKLAPLRSNASTQMLADYRGAARAVGVRLTIQHIDEHRFDGQVAYRGPGEPVPLGLTVLKELDKPVGERHLFNQTADGWAKMLHERQPMPVPRRAVEETVSRESVRDEQPAEPAYGMSPQTLADAPRHDPNVGESARNGAFGMRNASNAEFAELAELASRPASGERPVTPAAQRFKPLDANLMHKAPPPPPPRPRLR